MKTPENKTPKIDPTITSILVIIVGIFLLIGYHGSNSIRQAEAANGGPINVLLPKLEFLLIKDSDAAEIVNCKQLAYSVVTQFSNAASSVLVRHDKKLSSLGEITYNECLNRVKG